MIQFIVCEDDHSYTSKLNNIINQVLFQKEEEYQIINYPINEVDLATATSSNKIYLIDLTCNMDKALSLAKQICDIDTASQIIFIDADNGALNKVLKGHYIWLDYIDKTDINDQLTHIIEYVLKFLGRKKEVIIKQRNMIIRILLDDILYIMADIEKHGSIIITSYSEYNIRESLSSLKKRLNDNFFYSHRACLINIKRIQMVNWKNREIVFDNGIKTDLLSFRSSNELKKML